MCSDVKIVLLIPNLPFSIKDETIFYNYLLQ